MEKFSGPIDYEQTILDTVKVICDYYKGKIGREAHKMSKETYGKLLNAHAQLVEKSKMDCFWANRNWYTWAELLNLSDMRPFAEMFFEAAKDFKDRKAKGLDTCHEEQRLADTVKRVNIMAKSHSKLCVGIFGNANIIPSWLFAAHTKGASK